MVPVGANLKEAVVEAFRGLRGLPVDALLEQRYQKFRAMGVFEGG
jgi:acetyl-CoA carboxylase alpha subunit